jgi:hypothetical protein
MLQLPIVGGEQMFGVSVPLEESDHWHLSLPLGIRDRRTLGHESQSVLTLGELRGYGYEPALTQRRSNPDAAKRPCSSRGCSGARPVKIAASSS